MSNKKNVNNKDAKVAPKSDSEIKKQVANANSEATKAREKATQVKKKNKEKALDNKCPSCGAPIHFNPSLGKWKCDYCNSEFELADMQKHNNASASAHHSKSDVDDKVSYVSYKCKNCGAEIVADEQTAATFCLYCGNTAILKSKLSGKFSPDYIIPFKTEKEAAIKAFTNLSKGRPFVPKDFNNKENIEKIRGVYIPFWLYSLDIAGSVNFNGIISRSWTSGNRRYTKTDYYKLYRTGSMEFEKIPVDGSTRFDNNIMNSIEPFNYNELVPYNHAYLSGFFAERYDISGDVVLGEAVSRAIESAKLKMLSDAPRYSGKTIFENTLRSEVEKTEYALLPVWMVSVKYNDKYYIFAMNGQTGEFIGDIPLDKKKVWTWTILMFVGIMVAIIILSYIYYMTGGAA